MIPQESVRRKRYLFICPKSTIEMIQKAAGRKAIWVSIDTTIDTTGRFVVNVLIEI